MISMYIVQFELFFHLPVSDMRSDHYPWSRNRKPANFAYNCPFFHSHSTNISRIANLNAGGERAHNSAQSTYRSCYSTIRAHILNWSQSCWNCKSGTAVRFQPREILSVLCPGRVTIHRDTSGSGFWPGLDMDQTEPPVKTRTAGRLPGPIANTNWSATSQIPSTSHHVQFRDAIPDAMQYWNYKAFILFILMSG